MEKEIEGVKYTIIPVPPYASPYNVLLGDLLRRKPETAEDAEAISAEIKEAMDKLFAVTVTPTPRLEHHVQLFNALSELTTKVMTEAGLFRKDSGPDATEGGTDGSGAAQKTE